MTRHNYLKSGELKESVIQQLVVEYLILKGFRRFIIYIPNEAVGRIKRGAKAVRMGLRIGCSDLFITVPRHGKHGMWLELKSEKGILKEHQLEFLGDMESQGYFTSVAWSFEMAKQMLDWYLFE